MAMQSSAGLVRLARPGISIGCGRGLLLTVFTIEGVDADPDRGLGALTSAGIDAEGGSEEDVLAMAEAGRRVGG